ncbi:MAG TPA: LuxR family transcriptional regulator [Bryobacteraceae bacterium]|jgi:DNA-binding CsgD family transcriptional regulator
MPEQSQEFDELQKLMQEALADPGDGGRKRAIPLKRLTRELTAREREVLRLIAAGKSTKEIAHALGVALPTAVTHRYHLQQKLKARNTADLTRAAVRLGLIDF